MVSLAVSLDSFLLSRFYGLLIQDTYIYRYSERHSDHRRGFGNGVQTIGADWEAATAGADWEAATAGADWEAASASSDNEHDWCQDA